MPHSALQYFETATTPASTHAALKEVVTFINGQHATQSNVVPWACIDCYDGTTREQPTDGDMSNLTSGNLWREDEAGIPPQNSWAVFQAPSGGGVVDRFQIYVEMHTFQAMFLGMFCLNDWQIGGGTDANPTIPATSLGVPPFAGGVDFTIENKNSDHWRVWLDEGTIIIATTPTVLATQDWGYVGDLQPDNPLSVCSRPFVISRNPDSDGLNGLYETISVLDDSTVVSCDLQVAQGAGMKDADAQDAFTREAICEAALHGFDAGNRYYLGKMRNIAAITRHARSGLATTQRVTAGVGAADFDYEVWGVGSSLVQIVTKYPPGTSLPDGHIQLVERSIPDVLEP